VMLEKNKKGFSLVELSVVVAIISLLFASVSAAHKLTKQAKLNKAISELSELKLAISSFYSIYRKLPGDYSKASEVWPSETDGNGNGKLDGSEAETNWFTHLLAANLYKNTNGYDSSNLYKFYLNDSWSYKYQYNSLWSKYPYSNLLNITDHAASVAHSAYDLFRIDSKIDDGMPYTGKVMATANNSNSSCNSGNTNCCTNKDSMNESGFTASANTDAKYNPTATNCEYLFFYINF